MGQLKGKCRHPLGPHMSRPLTCFFRKVFTFLEHNKPDKPWKNGCTHQEGHPKLVVKEGAFLLQAVYWLELNEPKKGICAKQEFLLLEPYVLIWVFHSSLLWMFEARSKTCHSWQAVFQTETLFALRVPLTLIFKVHTVECAMQFASASKYEHTYNLGHSSGIIHNLLFNGFLNRFFPKHRQEKKKSNWIFLNTFTHWHGLFVKIICMKIYVFPLKKSSTNCRKKETFLSIVRPLWDAHAPGDSDAICSHLSLILDHAGDVLFPNPPEWRVIRQAFWRVAASLRDTWYRWQQQVHLLTAVSQCQSNQDAVQMKKCVEGKSVPLSLPGFKACCFFRFRWARTSFLYAYVQEVSFPTPCTCISKPTFYFYQSTES